MKFYVAENRYVEGDYEAAAVSKNGCPIALINGEYMSPNNWKLYESGSMLEAINTAEMLRCASEHRIEVQGGYHYQHAA